MKNEQKAIEFEYEFGNGSETTAMAIYWFFLLNGYIIDGSEKEYYMFINYYYILGVKKKYYYILLHIILN
jgi:hypothetical protein